MSRRRKDFGDWGERLACDFLRRHGFKVVGQNYFTSAGEIDIIATKGGDYYFIEVKARRTGDLAHDTAITTRKRENLARLINSYCYKHNIADRSVIPAGLILSVDKGKGTVRFMFCVLY